MRILSLSLLLIGCGPSPSRLQFPEGSGSSGEEVAIRAEKPTHMNQDVKKPEGSSDSAVGISTTGANNGGNNTAITTSGTGTTNSSGVGTSEPKPLTNAPLPPEPKGKGKTDPKSRNSKLSAKECEELMDRFIYVTVSAPGGPLAGSSESELEQSKGFIRQYISQDPNYKNFQKTCVKDATKTQYECAMASTTQKEWTSCVK